MFRSMRPNITITANGTRMIPTLSTKLIQLFGFSNGCVELGPKNPPPSAKNCFGATIAATGPRAMTCGLALAVGIGPHRAGFNRRGHGVALQRHRHAADHVQCRRQPS